MADAPTLHRLVLSATKRGKILKRTLPEIKKTVHSFFVAEAKGRIIGCCALEVYSKKLAEIRSLTVESAFGGKGIASALLALCLKEARRKRVYEVLVITNKDSLFRRRGFSQQLHDQKALFLRP